MKKYLSIRKVVLPLVLAVILIGAIVVAGISCATTDGLWFVEQTAAAQIAVDSFSTREQYSMVVLYLREGNYFVMSITGTHDFWVADNKLYMDDEVIVNDVAEIGWGLYPEQKVELPCEWDERLGDCIEIPVTLEDLNLRDFEAADLPQSGHYARLDAIYPGSVLKAEVSRFFYGEWFTGIRCLVTLSVVEAYQAGDIQLGDYMWVYYTNDPRPGHEHEEIPIVIDKVMVG